MRVLLSTIGSRGDVQPLVALATELRAHGHEPRLCVPPDFREWAEGLGFPVVPIGPELRRTAQAGPAAPPPTPAQRRAMIAGTVATQFETVAAAAAGCDLVVGATALQVAALSVAERMGVPYVFVAYCPAVVPSPRHPPLPLGMLDDPAAAAESHDERWARDARRWNDHWGALVNARRAALGLPPVDDVRAHVLTARPWLAADPTLGPWPEPGDGRVFQTGAWILPDDRPLDPALERFLDAGEPPVYFGFGSVRAAPDLARAMVESARALGRRAVLSRGWADLSLPDDAPDCLAIRETNLQALFPRVAAAVHHGGAGTTTAAALAGAPQVVVPQMFDQHYWARRVAALGVGAAHGPTPATSDSLARALDAALRPEVAARARAIAADVRRDGARAAAAALGAYAPA